MQFVDIQNEVRDLRFSENDRSRIKNWINARYGQIWGADDWHFKRTAPVTLTVTSGDDTPTMPSDFGRVNQVFDDQGNELVYRSPWEFEAIDQQDIYANTSARPGGYTIINRQIILVPPPNTAYTFKVSYEKTVCHLESGVATAGLLSSETDTPIWDEAHHYILVVGALATGMKLINDPNAQAVEQEFAQMMQVMRDDLLPPDRGSNLQYGRDSLGDDFWG